MYFDAPQGIDLNGTNNFEFHHEISIGNHCMNIKKPAKDLRKSNGISVMNDITFSLLSHAFLLSSEIKLKQKFIREVL